MESFIRIPKSKDEIVIYQRILRPKERKWTMGRPYRKLQFAVYRNFLRACIVAMMSFLTYFFFIVYNSKHKENAVLFTGMVFSYAMEMRFYYYYISYGQTIPHTKWCIDFDR